MLHALIARLGTPDVHFLGHVSQRGADGALRRRRSVPLRQRARGLLRADHRGVLQARAGARLRRDRRARDDGRRRRALRDARIRSRSRRLMDAVLDDAALEDAVVASQDAALAAAAGAGFRRHAAALRRPGCSQRPAAPAPEVAWDFWAAVRPVRAARGAAAVPAGAVSGAARIRRQRRPDDPATRR